MKHLILSVLISLSVTALTQAQSKWNIGLEAGPLTNLSKFESGDEQANALFTNNLFRSGNISVIAKYSISENKAIQTGVSLSHLGFSYGMSKDYSLKNPFERNEEIKSEIGMITIPAMMLIHTRKNCNNIRFVFGAGASVRFIENVGGDTQSADITSEQFGASRTTTLNATTSTVSVVSAALTWKIGIEKSCRNGGLFTLTYMGNQGLNSVAESSVTYTIDGKAYKHNFINRGSFINFGLGYQFAPFGSRKLQNISK